MQRYVFLNTRQATRGHLLRPEFMSITLHWCCAVAPRAMAIGSHSSLQGSIAHSFLSSSNVKGGWHLLREFSEYLREFSNFLRELSNYLRDILEKLGVFLSILSAKYLPSTLHLKINH